MIYILAVNLVVLICKCEAYIVSKFDKERSAIKVTNMISNEYNVWLRLSYII